MRPCIVRPVGAWRGVWRRLWRKSCIIIVSPLRERVHTLIYGYVPNRLEQRLHCLLILVRPPIDGATCWIVIRGMQPRNRKMQWQRWCITAAYPLIWGMVRPVEHILIKYRWRWKIISVMMPTTSVYRKSCIRPIVLMPSLLLNWKPIVRLSSADITMKADTHLCATDVIIGDISISTGVGVAVMMVIICWLRLTREHRKV